MRTRWFLVALAVALGALGTLQALTVPIGDRTGAFVDETRHFARTVGAARYMTRALGWAPLQIFDYQLQALITRPDLSVDAEARAYERYSRSAWWLSDLYFVYGVPQMLLPAGTTLVTRFLVSRLFLLLFGIALIPVIYATNRWLFGPRLLALAATATTVLMPSFVIFMVTLSTDAGAIVVMSVLLACAAWGWAQGWNRLRVYLLVLAVFMALVAKQTVWAALLAGGFFFGVPPIVRGLWRNLPRLPWELQVGFAALLVAAAGLGVQALPVVCCRAAYWYYPSAIPHDDITLPLREQANGGPVLSAIRVDPLLGDRAPFQYVAPAGVRELRGEWATVGAWVRAPAGQSVHLPRLSSEDAQPTAFIASGEWQFGSYAVQIDQAAQDLRVTLPGSTAVSNSLAFMKNTRVRHVRVVQQPEPAAKIEALEVFPVYGDAARSVGMPAELVASGATADGNSWLEWDFGAVQPIRGLVFMPILARDNLPKWSVLVSSKPLRASGVIPALGTVSYSGVVVARGQFQAGTMPLFEDGRHQNGTWGGLAFINLVDNPNGGVGWPMFTGFSDRGLNRRLYSLLDLGRTLPAYFTGLRAIFATLWGAFAGDYPGLPPFVIGCMALLVWLALTGIGRGLLRGTWFFKVARGRQQGAIALLAFFVISSLAAVVLRIDIFPNLAQPFFYATARFLLPALPAVTGLLALGLFNLCPQLWHRRLVGGLLLGLFAANLIMLFGAQLPWYACPLENRWWCIWWS